MKFKFVCSWCNDKDCQERLLRNWLVPADIEVVEENYDYLVILNNYSEIRTTEYHKNIGLILEPSWSPSYNRELHRYCRYVFTNRDKMCYENVIDSNPIQFSNDSGIESFSYANLLSNKSFKKQNKMSIIVSNWSWADQNHNYFLREELVRKILETDLDIHIYGKNWFINDQRYKGNPEKKQAGLEDYEFSIAIENCLEDSYVTEKLFDCFLYNTVPLYYGTNTVGNFYDEESIIKLDLKSDSIIDHIKDVYYNYNNRDYKEAVLKQKEDYFTGKHNIFKVLKEILK